MSAISLSKFGENLPATGVTAAAQAAIGFAAGLIVADKLGAENRRRTALIVAGAGLVTLVPIVAGIISRVSNRPGSSRRMRKSLENHPTRYRILRQRTRSSELDAGTHLVLASASPRRRELLERAGFAVRCEPSGCEELILHDSPRELALTNAELKGRAVAARFPGEVVLAADTIVILDGRIFGKPINLTEAEKMLSALSDRTHEVVTGVYIRRDDRAVRFSEATRVRFRAFAQPEISDYFRDIDPLDKAGAYAAQEDRGRLIERIEGSFSNVVGLPVERVASSLAQHFGITP